MSVITTYFAAPDDAAAAAVIDWPTGPARRPDGTPGYPNLDTNGIEPFVLLGQLEAAITGRTYDEVSANPRYGGDVAIIDHGERIIATVTDTLAAALAAATPEQLSAAAVTWAQAEEFWGRGDPVALTSFAERLAAIARDARDAGHLLYCFVSV